MNYFEFYVVAEGSISKKFYKTYVEVFKSLEWDLELTPSLNFGYNF